MGGACCSRSHAATVPSFCGPPQRADVGMFLQSFLLLCSEQGLATACMEIRSLQGDLVCTGILRNSSPGGRSGCRLKHSSPSVLTGGGSQAQGLLARHRVREV